MKEHSELILDGTKINWHLDRVKQWENGERIAPITIDMALTRACNYSCGFCYAMFQENDRGVITKKIIFDFPKSGNSFGGNAGRCGTGAKAEERRSAARAWAAGT